MKNKNLWYWGSGLVVLLLVGCASTDYGDNYRPNTQLGVYGSPQQQPSVSSSVTYVEGTGPVDTRTLSQSTYPPQRYYRNPPHFVNTGGPPPVYNVDLKPYQGRGYDANWYYRSKSKRYYQHYGPSIRYYPGGYYYNNAN